ncbi:MAG: OmpA family protein [Pseudomonadota bacterium]
MLIISLVAGCGPSHNQMMAKDHLDRARNSLAQAESNQYVTNYGQGHLTEAGDAIKAGELASDYKEIDHQAYLAERKTQIAKAITEGKLAEKEEEAYSRQKDRLVLQTKRQVDAKSFELKEAKMDAKDSAVVLAQTERDKMDAEAQARIAEGEVDAKSLELKEAEMEAENRTLVLAQTERDKMDAEAKARKAEKEKAENKMYIRELSKLMVRQTDRGVVVTLGDVLFSTGRVALSPKADYNIDKLVAFMNKYPRVNVLVEGYTDSVGKEKMNIALSEQRADAVGAKLTDKGINPERITMKGYGEEYATADNGTIDGRKQNRRVEVLLLSEGVNPADRMRN